MGIKNIIGVINPGASQRLLLLAHWDTRPWADNDPDPSNHTKPVMGANDGASGVAVLLQLARQLNAENTTLGVDIVLAIFTAGFMQWAEGRVPIPMILVKVCMTGFITVVHYIVYKKVVFKIRKEEKRCE